MNASLFVGEHVLSLLAVVHLMVNGAARNPSHKRGGRMQGRAGQGGKASADACIHASTLRPS